MADIDARRANELHYDMESVLALTEQVGTDGSTSAEMLGDARRLIRKASDAFAKLGDAAAPVPTPYTPAGGDASPVLPAVLYWSPSLAAREPDEPLAGLIDMTVASVPFCQVDGGWCPMSATKLPDDMRRLVVEHPTAFGQVSDV